MPIMLNTILTEAGVPLANVRLIRHKDQRAARGRTPYELWRDNRPAFELYQATQSIPNRSKLNSKYWAVFIADTNNDTMFAGLYAVRYRGLLEKDAPKPHMEGFDKAGTCDLYGLTLHEGLKDLIGKLFIDWGSGALAWVQYADRHNKPVTELRIAFEEPRFPGFLNFLKPLSTLTKLPKSWVGALESTRGVYLLTCARTKEQYVGSATGEAGFWGRWCDYVETGHGGVLALKSRDPSDYQVSILEVAGTSATPEDILAMEGRWQAKLQSRAMGLNRNSAGEA
jgi:hypothetical protein